VNDIYQAIEFYKQPGFNLIMTVPEQGNYFWASLTSENVTFMFQTFNSLGDELKSISRQNGGSLYFISH
jgi:protein associated with RNAse G/E